MNLSIVDELELFSKELQQYMSPGALEKFPIINYQDIWEELTSLII